MSPPPGRTITHVVQPGESPWSIAQLYGISDREVMAWNYLSPWDPIYAGQHLLIPVTPTATYAAPPTPTATLPTPTGRSMEPTLAVLPALESRLSSPTVSPAMHSGTISNGTQLLAVAVGLVLIVIGAIGGMRR